MQGRNYQTSSNFRYGMNGKEKDDEIKGSGNSYDFGARIYDSRLGRTLSQDPHSAKYPALSPYSMFANNPIIYVDKDGKDISVSTVFNEDGSKSIMIVVTGKIINNSSKVLTEDNMKSYANRLSEAIIKDYSLKVPGVTVTVKTDITAVTSEVQIKESDHVFRIVDANKIPKTPNEIAASIAKNGNASKYESAGTVGKALYGENLVYINADIIDAVPATTGPFAGTGKTTTGGATLERTGPHELGHAAKLLHVADDGNLMVQTKEPNGGTNIKKEQIQLIEKYHNEGKLNKGKQEIKN